MGGREATEEQEDAGGAEAAAGSTSTAEVACPLPPLPPKLALWRENLFRVPRVLIMSEKEFNTYFKYVDNAFLRVSVHSTTTHTIHYYNCRLNPKTKSSQADPSVPPEKRRKTTNRLDKHGKCSFTMKVVEHHGTSPTDYMRGLDRWYQVMRTNPDNPENPDHTHDLDELDKIKLNSVLRSAMQKEAKKGTPPQELYRAMKAGGRALDEAGGRHLKRQHCINAGIAAQRAEAKQEEDEQDFKMDRYTPATSDGGRRGSIATTRDGGHSPVGMYSYPPPPPPPPFGHPPPPFGHPPPPPPHHWGPPPPPPFGHPPPPPHHWGPPPPPPHHMHWPPPPPPFHGHHGPPGPPPHHHWGPPPPFHGHGHGGRHGHHGPGGHHGGHHGPHHGPPPHHYPPAPPSPTGSDNARKWVHYYADSHHSQRSPTPRARTPKPAAPPKIPTPPSLNFDADSAPAAVNTKFLVDLRNEYKIPQALKAHLDSLPKDLLVAMCVDACFSREEEGGRVCVGCEKMLRRDEVATHECPAGTADVEMELGESSGGHVLGGQATLEEARGKSREYERREGSPWVRGGTQGNKRKITAEGDVVEE